MKRRMLSIILALTATVLLAVLVTACGGKNVPEKTDVPGVDVFKILTDNTINCKFIQPAAPTDDEKSVIQNFRTSFFKQAKIQITLEDDTVDTSAEEFVVLLGNTAYAESKTVYEGLGEREAAVRIIGNKLVIAFGGQNVGKKLVSALMEELAKNTAMQLAGTYTLSCTVKPDTGMMPKYPSGSVQTIDCGPDATMNYIVGSNDVDFEGYCDELESIGFEKIESHAQGQNVYYTFVGETEYIYAYYTGYNDSVRIVWGPIETLGSMKNDSGAEEKYTPVVSMVSQAESGACGQGFIFLLPDGRLLVQDSGLIHSSNPDFMYKAIKDIAPDPDNIVIAAWFISHTHDDHQPGFEEFVENHANDKTVKIEQLVVNYANPEDYDFVRDDGVSEMGSKNKVLWMNNVTKTKLKDTQYVKPHTGQTFSYGSVDVEILYTVEDLYPKKFDYGNSTSLVIRVNIGGQSVLLLADTTHTSSSILESMHGSHLESDMMQIAHHGIFAGHSSMYNKIKAKVMFWPATEQYVSEWLNDGTVGVALSHASDLYIAYLGTTKLELPYTIQNNKDTVLASVR